MSNAADMTYEQAMAPFIGPRYVAFLIKGEPYRGAHTARALKAAMTRAGAYVCGHSGSPRGEFLALRAADLAWLRGTELG